MNQQKDLLMFLALLCIILILSNLYLFKLTFTLFSKNTLKTKIRRDFNFLNDYSDSNLSSCRLLKTSDFSLYPKKGDSAE